MSQHISTTSTSSKKQKPNKTLFIVESPNKVKTIEKYLGDNFIVRATVGHIADIPERNGAVDIANNFTPHYELTEKGAEIVAGLKKDLTQCSQVIVATDGDREGEIIAAHVIEFVQPAVPVQRVVFHAVTKDAIDTALQNPRDIDANLVEAARTRRILDRLFGFNVSDVSRQKVRQNTSAGRVQSPALRLVVERELERQHFIPASYADVVATSNTTPTFTAALKSIDDVAIATGKDFSAQGALEKDVKVLDLATAETLAVALSKGAITLVVADISMKEATQNPRPPFTMSTLYQDAVNRLGMSVKEAQVVSNWLHEKGFITYPRTDNPVHDPGSRHQIRAAITRLYGGEAVAPFHRYTTSKKNAQGAHEAIRPTYIDNQSPKSLTDRQRAMYQMIWQRTIASQMVEAKGTTQTVLLRTQGGAMNALFSAAGTTYSQPGFRQVYAPVNEETESAPFPHMELGEDVPVATAEAREHHTTPPPRFNEASLVRELEKLGIGRPSTYAPIIAKLREKYVWSKKGERAFIPTVTAFAVHRLLTSRFSDLLDYGFTNDLEELLDQISEDASLRTPILNAFYFGDDTRDGLETLVTTALAEVKGEDMFALSLGIHPETGDDIVVHAGKMFGKTFSPYIKCGAVTRSLSDKTDFETLTVDQILSLVKGGSESPLGEIDGVPVFVKVTADSAYFQWGTKGNLPAGAKKPKSASFLKSMKPDSVTLEDAIKMLSLPRVVGESSSGHEIRATMGMYGAYITCNGETRSLKDDELVFTITVEEAQKLLDTPKKNRGRQWKKK